jgi:hypothetical protein
MRSRHCSGSGWPSGDTKGSGRGVTSKAPLGPTWKEGQAALPRRRPQPSSRILTAWKGNSPKFAQLRSPGSDRRLPTREHHNAGVVGIVSSSAAYIDSLTWVY